MPAVLVTAGVLVDFVMVSTGATTVKVADEATVLFTAIALIVALRALIGSVLV